MVDKRAIKRTLLRGAARWQVYPIWAVPNPDGTFNVAWVEIHGGPQMQVMDIDRAVEFIFHKVSNPPQPFERVGNLPAKD